MLVAAHIQHIVFLSLCSCSSVFKGYSNASWTCLVHAMLAPFIIMSSILYLYHDNRDCFSEKLRFLNEFLKIKYVSLKKITCFSLNYSEPKYFAKRFYLSPSNSPGRAKLPWHGRFRVPFCWSLQSDRGQVVFSKGNTSLF